MEKTCTRCKIARDIAQFGRDSKAPDGRFYWCKDCLHDFNTSPERRVYSRRYLKEWSKKPHGREKLRLYHQSDRYKQIQKDWRKKENEQFPGKVAARHAVHYAVKTGKLPRPDSLLCVHCEAPAAQYHHALGYAREHRLHVEPICKACHALFNTRHSDL